MTTAKELTALQVEVGQFEVDNNALEENGNVVEEIDGMIEWADRLCTKLHKLIAEEPNYVTRDQLGQLFATLDVARIDLRELRVLEADLDQKCTGIDRGAEAYLFSDAVIAPRRRFSIHAMRYSRQRRSFRRQR